ncbi:unnamed protein product, partial [Heterotrigona itama]
WVAGEWSMCSASCGGGSRTRNIFCTEENGNETTKLPDHKCSSTHKPRNQETCNTISCPMWETNKWSEVSTRQSQVPELRPSRVNTRCNMQNEQQERYRRRQTKVIRLTVEFRAP